MKNYWNRLTAVVHEIKTELFSSFISVLYHLLPLLCVFWNSIEKCCLYTQQQSRSAQFDANTINAAALDIITTPGTSGDISILFSLHSSTLLCIYRHFFFVSFFLFVNFPSFIFFFFLFILYTQRGFSRQLLYLLYKFTRIFVVLLY